MVFLFFDLVGSLEFIFENGVLAKLVKPLHALFSIFHILFFESSLLLFLHYFVLEFFFVVLDLFFFEILIRGCGQVLLLVLRLVLFCLL